MRDGDLLLASPRQRAFTVSETFPWRCARSPSRCSIGGHRVGGVAGPALFGVLIDTACASACSPATCSGAALMIAAALIAWRFCVNAERKSLEESRGGSPRGK